MYNYLAQREIPIGDQPLNGFGELGNPGGNAPSLFDTIISNAVAVITVVAGLYFLFVLISGAISMISAGGDKGAVAEARQKITTGLIGLVIVISAIFLVDLIGTIIDFPSILQPGTTINNLGF